MPSHQSHETVSSRNRSRRNQRTLTCGVVDIGLIVHRVLSLAGLMFERGLCVVTFEQAIDYRYTST